MRQRKIAAIWDKSHSEVLTRGVLGANNKNGFLASPVPRYYSPVSTSGSRQAAVAHTYFQQVVCHGEVWPPSHRRKKSVESFRNNGNHTSASIDFRVISCSITQ